MSREPWNWTKEDLDALIGQAESLRLDFKQSRLFSEPHDKVVDNLSCEISAFANTEGGTIVIGIIERRDGKARLADGFDDGVDTKIWSPERIQQICESNISPPLRGLRVKAIPLDEARTKHAILIYVPSGNTAHQAHDRYYYGRSEYESKPMLDHEIRLLMLRGKAPNAIINVAYCEKHIRVITTDDANSETVQSHTFELVLENIGEINITEFKVQVIYSPEGIGGLADFVRTYKDGWPDSNSGYSRFREIPLVMPMKVNIFPDDIFQIAQVHIGPLSPETARDSGLTLHWKVYLSNSAPISGEIDLVATMEQAEEVS